MFRLAYEILKDFGTLGVTIVQFGVILILVWKFGTNHWKHLTADVKSIKNDQSDMKNQLDNYGQRISTVEGQLK